MKKVMIPLRMRPRKIEERKKIGRELLQGVQETMMKVSKSSSKACSHDLVIFVATKSCSMLFQGKNKHGSCNNAIISGVANRCKSDP